MGKSKQKYLYGAYEKDGKRIGYVFGDRRLTVEEEAKEDALAEIKRTHNELLADMKKLGETE